MSCCDIEGLSACRSLVVALLSFSFRQAGASRFLQLEAIVSIEKGASSVLLAG